MFPIPKPHPRHSVHRYQKDFFTNLIFSKSLVYLHIKGKSLLISWITSPLNSAFQPMISTAPLTTGSMGYIKGQLLYVQRESQNDIHEHHPASNTVHMCHNEINRNIVFSPQFSAVPNSMQYLKSLTPQLEKQNTFLDPACNQGRGDGRVGPKAHRAQYPADLFLLRIYRFMRVLCVCV